MSCDLGLSGCELAEIAATVADTFDQTATLQRPTQADDGQGGRTTSEWTTVGSYACNVLPNRDPREIQEGNRLVSEGEWRIRLPLSAVVYRKDRLVVGGYTYEVLGTDAGRSAAVAVEVTCRRLDR